MGSTTSTPSRAQIEELRVRVQKRLQELRERPKATPPNPPPRYDEVFARGQQWLDELAAGPDLEQQAEP